MWGTCYVSFVRYTNHCGYYSYYPITDVHRTTTTFHSYFLIVDWKQNMKFFQSRSINRFSCSEGNLSQFHNDRTMIIGMIYIDIVTYRLRMRSIRERSDCPEVIQYWRMPCSVSMYRSILPSKVQHLPGLVPVLWKVPWDLRSRLWTSGTIWGPVVCAEVEAQRRSATKLPWNTWKLSNDKTLIISWKSTSHRSLFLL